MRSTLKLTLPLALSVAAVALLFAGDQVRTERKNLRNDLARQAEGLADSVQENAEHLRERNLLPALKRLVDKIGQHEHLKGIAIYDVNGAPLVVTTGLPSRFQSLPPVGASDPVRVREVAAARSSRTVTRRYMRISCRWTPTENATERSPSSMTPTTSARESLRRCAMRSSPLFCRPF